MLDINDLIAERGGNPEKVRECVRRRYGDVKIVDEVIAIYEDHRRTQYAATQVGNKVNAVQKQIGQRKKAKEDAADLLKEKEDLQNQKLELDKQAAEKLATRDRKLKSIGNYVHDSVPVNNNEDFNEMIKTWAPTGAQVEKKDCYSHHEVLTLLDGYDPVRGVKLSGHRGYCLTGMGFFLNQALINYGTNFLYERGYTPVQPPFFMNKDAMSKTAQLEQFDEELYKVTETEGDEDSAKYLIATSEQPISAMHEGEWMLPKDLPIRYAGYSTNFRKEAGAHGKDAWGIFRVHQFEKVEQFVFTDPEKSWEEFDRMIGTSEAFYQSLGLPYRIVSIVSGALNNAASKKYDLEAWFPFQGEYKELVSCSNCTDYQTRELEIRFGAKKAKSDEPAAKAYCHALNSTLCATERALCCVLENYQTPEGLNVPEVLRKYIPGEKAFLPFVKELPKDSTSLKAKSKTDAKASAASKASKAGDVVDKVKNLKV